MSILLRRGVVLCLGLLLPAAACTVDPPGGGAQDASPADGAVADTAVATDTSAPDTSASDTSAPDTFAPDSTPADSSTADASADGAADAMSEAATDASRDGCVDDGGPPDSGLSMARLLTACENDGTYDVVATCTMTPINQLGPAGGCCREAAYTTTTTCTTALHEVPDGAGNLVLRIDPMAGCATTSTPTACSQVGDAAACDGAALTCPLAAYPQPGAPSLLEGTYGRVVWTDRFMTRRTVRAEYRAHCAEPFLVPQTTVPSCSTVPPTRTLVTTATKFTKVSAGTFRVRRGWASRSSTLNLCAMPIIDVVDNAAVTNDRFTEGNPPAAGAFATTSYLCTYTFTLR
ncbi:MAG TPA: hypothetical protein PLR99_17740 [Polyangiaceae bacterium]|nr:hypothetical protein [Polyangiaceae bacterium]